MGYFSNSSEGEDYHDRYCYKCVHMLEDCGCPCDIAHVMWNYDECNNDDSILHKMIPRDEKGRNQKCIFFEAIDDYNKR